jgi:hypothetical protein
MSRLTDQVSVRRVSAKGEGNGTSSSSRTGSTGVLAGFRKGREVQEGCYDLGSFIVLDVTQKIAT